MWGPVTRMNTKTDILEIGGGIACCMAAIAAREYHPNVKIMILEKGGEKQRNYFVFS